MNDSSNKKQVGGGELQASRIHGKGQHEQRIVYPFVIKNFMWVIWLHTKCKVKPFFSLSKRPTKITAILTSLFERQCFMPASYLKNNLFRLNFSLILVAC